MAAVLRVKRKRTDDPLSALVLTYKRSRPAAYDSSDPGFSHNYENKIAQQGTSTGGGGESQEERQKETKKEVFQLYTSTDASQTDFKIGLRKILPVVGPEKIHCADLRNFWSRKTSKCDNLVEEFRSYDPEELEECMDHQSAEADPTLAELNGAFEAFSQADTDTVGESAEENLVGHSGIECNGVEMIRIKNVTELAKSPSEYVYDFYYSSGISEGEFRRMENWLGVEPYYSELLVAEEEDTDRDSNIFQDDEDDSNDENNWRNDYPDEEEWGKVDDFFDELDFEEYDKEGELLDEEETEGPVHLMRKLRMAEEAEAEDSAGEDDSYGYSD